MQTVFSASSKLKWRFYVGMLLVVALLFPTLPAMSEAASTASSIKPVYINSNSYVKLDSADILSTSKGKTASFTITFYNGGSKAINLQDYWFRLASTSGTKYTLYMLDSDKTKKTVQANSNVTLTFYSELPSSMTLPKLIFKVVKFDFSVAGYEKTLGQFKFPADYSTDVKAGGYSSVKLNSTPVNIRISKSTMSTSTDNNTVNIELAMRNTSSSELSIANLQFLAQSAAGGMYKMKVTSTTSGTADAIVLRPKILETIKLSITLPKSVSTKGQKLVITQGISSGTGEGASSLSLPVSKIGYNLKTANTATSTSYEYIKDDYTYKMNVASIQRNTWGGEDSLIGKLVITNTSSKTAPIPAIEGSLYLGDKAAVKTTIIPFTNPVAIPAKSSITIYYTGTVPTTTSLTDLKLKLFEKSGESQTELAALKTPAAIVPKSIAIGSENNVNDIGENFAVNVMKTQLLEGNSNNLYAVYLDVTNKQSRAIATSKLVGFLKTADGDKYDIKLLKTSNLINPGKKEQIIVTTEVPKQLDLTGASVVLGSAFNAQGIVKKDDAEISGFVNPVSYALPQYSQTITSEFNKVQVGPYTINMDNIITYLTDDKIDVDFSGQVTKDLSYEGFSAKKFTFAIEDQSTNISMINAPFELEGAGGTAGQYVWKVGNNYTNIVQSVTDKLVAKTIQLNIYEEINGYKTKLVSKNIKWSAYLNWADPKNKEF
ncbi:hypothetical protein [Paenibacillus sp. KS-LC4]|uniref:hypothetical protein n=1 Tax=Paenibacillus sp. KS-LC4 TaxID=2979727 RepID=UPI0030D1A5CB